MVVRYRYNKIIEKTKLKGRKVYLGSWFLRFQFMVTWGCYFWAMVKQILMVGTIAIQLMVSRNTE